MLAVHLLLNVLLVTFQNFFIPNFPNIGLLLVFKIGAEILSHDQHIHVLKV